MSLERMHAERGLPDSSRVADNAYLHFVDEIHSASYRQQKSEPREADRREDSWNTKLPPRETPAERQRAEDPSELDPIYKFEKGFHFSPPEISRNKVEMPTSVKTGTGLEYRIEYDESGRNPNKIQLANGDSLTRLEGNKWRCTLSDGISLDLMAKVTVDEKGSVDIQGISRPNSIKLGADGLVRASLHIGPDRPYVQTIIDPRRNISLKVVATSEVQLLDLSNNTVLTRDNSGRVTRRSIESEKERQESMLVITSPLLLLGS